MDATVRYSNISIGRYNLTDTIRPTEKVSMNSKALYFSRLCCFSDMQNNANSCGRIFKIPYVYRILSSGLVSNTACGRKRKMP